MEGTTAHGGSLLRPHASAVPDAHDLNPFTTSNATPKLSHSGSNISPNTHDHSRGSASIVKLCRYAVPTGIIRAKALCTASDSGTTSGVYVGLLLSNLCGDVVARLGLPLGPLTQRAARLEDALCLIAHRSAHHPLIAVAGAESPRAPSDPLKAVVAAGGQHVINVSSLYVAVLGSFIARADAREAIIAERAKGYVASGATSIRLALHQGFLLVSGPGAVARRRGAFRSVAGLYHRSGQLSRYPICTKARKEVV